MFPLVVQRSTTFYSLDCTYIAQPLLLPWTVCCIQNFHCTVGNFQIRYVPVQCARIPYILTTSGLTTGCQFWGRQYWAYQLYILTTQISQSYNIEVPVWIASRLPTPIIRFFCAHYWFRQCFEVTKFVSKSACLIKCSFEVVRKILTNQIFDNLFKS